jgi:hypothetical protein
LTLRTPAVGYFSRRWAAALAESGRVMGTVDEIAEALRPLTLRIALSVRDGVEDAELGRDVGASLMRHGYGTTAVIGPTVTVLLEAFAAEFAPCFSGRSDVADAADLGGRPEAVLRVSATKSAASRSTKRSRRFGPCASRSSPARQMRRCIT